MKAIRLLCVAIIALNAGIGGLAQTQPNLENGFKPFGSYDGTKLDTVNMMNGNVMLHAPYLSYPQRGRLDSTDLLYASSKGWQVHCSTGSNGNEICFWTSGGTGVALQRSEGVTVHRYVDISYDPTGTTFSEHGYTIIGADGVTHQLYAIPGSLDSNGNPTKFESLDNSGFSLTANVPDANGISGGFSVVDRQGKQFLGIFGAYAQCPRMPPTLSVPTVPGGHAPDTTDDKPFGDKSCPQYGWGYQVTDSNGNRMTLSVPGHSTSGVDTLGRSQALESGASTDTTGCVSNTWPVSGAWLLSYTGPGGTQLHSKQCLATLQLQTAFNYPGIMEAQNSANYGGTVTVTPMVTFIEQDGSKWTFDYDSYANITLVGLPTGGSISYTWTTIPLPFCGDPTPVSRAVNTRTLTDNNGNSQTWSYHWGTPANGSITNWVTDPLGNDTVHVFTALDATTGCSFYETSTRYYHGSKDSNQLLKRVDTTYTSLLFPVDTVQSGAVMGNVVPTTIQTTIYPSGQVSKITKQYDNGLGPNAPIFGNVVVEKEYDWGPGSAGSLLREIDTTYKWQVNSAYLTAHLLNLPASVIVKDGSGCALSETDYTYDESTYLTGYEATVGTLPAGTHVAAPAAVRGNLTTVTKWLAPAGTCNPKGGTAISSHTNWYDTGEAHLQIDALGRTTTHSYDLAYAGAYSTETCAPTTSSIAHCVSGTYDFATGLLTSFTNENATSQASGNTPGDSAHTNTYSYDQMFRTTSAVLPPDPNNSNAQPQTTWAYSAPNVFPLTVTRTKSTTNTLSDSVTTLFDGLGRVYKTEHAVPGGPANVDTTYDAVGQVSDVTNPYYSTSDPTYGTTHTDYDALGRPIKVTKQDGSYSTVAYSVTPDQSVSGDCTLTKDEAGNQRLACSDALGRLTEVHEPNPGAPATLARGWVTIGGSEQNPTGQPGAPGAGTITITGAEQSTTGTCFLSHCVTIYDTGSVGIAVGTYPAKSYTYGAADLPNTVAWQLSCLFHYDPNSPLDASCPASAGTSTQVALTARGAGSSTNYSFTTSSATADLTDFGGPSFFASPASGALSGGRDAILPDTGTVTITIGGVNYSAAYGASDTAYSIASNLALAISAGTQANASVSGSGTSFTIALASKSPGNYDYSLSAAYTWSMSQYANPSFTAAASGPALTGGYNYGDTNNNPLITQYQYDALGNLLRVDQKGSAPGDSTQWRTRLFTYDSLTRLLTAYNPESGTISYSYDANGNVKSKTAPAVNQTGSATVTTTYAYDELNRLTSKTYSDSTPSVTYGYDVGCCGVDPLNGLGRMTYTMSGNTELVYVYDRMGRITEQADCPPSGIQRGYCYAFYAYYDLAGDLTYLSYPDGQTAISYTPDSAGRMISAVDNNHGISYVSSATYGPDNSLTGFVSGNSGAFAGITNSFSYNKRLQPVFMSASIPSQTVFSIGYDFHAGNGTAGSGSDNGNVYALTNNRDHTRDQTFTYDALNRLTSAQNAGTDCSLKTLNPNQTEYWGNSYGYDAWGNLLTKSVTKCSAEPLNETADAQNRMHVISGADYSYDAAGNMTSDVTFGHSYAYDAQNRVLHVDGTAASYTYNSLGNRVRKDLNGGSSTEYFYFNGQIVAELNPATGVFTNYVFFDGDRVARRDGTTGPVSYYFSDHLKTATVITDAAGNIQSESDYYPWGGELQFLANDSNHYKFTGKERDNETQLDYFGARYYSNGPGRFITPDWAAKATAVPYAEFADPQSLNLYTYVRNIPTTRYDADGHDGWDTIKLIVNVGVVWIEQRNEQGIQNLKSLANSLANSGPPHAGALPVPQPCTCPGSGNQSNNNSSQNENNSYSSNTQEQGRDAQGRFLPKKGGEAPPGSTAEKQGLDSVGAVKNTEKLNGTIRDGTIPETGQHVEVKSGASISNTEQLTSMGQTAVDATGKPLKVVTTNPNVKVSGKALANENLEFEHKPQK